MEKFYFNIAKLEYLCVTLALLRDRQDEVRVARFPEPVNFFIAEDLRRDPGITFVVTVDRIRKRLLGFVHQVAKSPRLVPQHG